MYITFGVLWYVTIMKVVLYVVATCKKPFLSLQIEIWLLKQMPAIGINNALSEAFSCTFHLLTLKAILLWADMLPLLLLFVTIRGVIGRVFSFFHFFLITVLENLQMDVKWHSLLRFSYAKWHSLLQFSYGRASSPAKGRPNSTFQLPHTLLGFPPR